MSNGYRAVGWNPQKKKYDRIILTAVLLYLALFIAMNLVLFPFATIETVLIRAFGSAALVLLHLLLVIGPLCRLSPRFLPLLYNRRHLGVTLFLLGLAHAILVVIQYHAFSSLDPLLSIFISNGSWQGVSTLPFQPLGFVALAILFLMAATSHDFWLTNLTAPVWKALHMLVYLAYTLLLLHVAFGILQAETQPIYAVLLGLGALLVFSLHLAAARKEKRLDSKDLVPDQEGWVKLCRPDDIREKRARIFRVAGERVAVFRYDGKASAVSNLCQHQNGPLGEGKIVDGCITCPWHGYQYRPHDGASPAPFTEKVPTFRLKLRADSIWLHVQPLPPGTALEPLELPATSVEQA